MEKACLQFKHLHHPGEKLINRMLLFVSLLFHLDGLFLYFSPWWLQSDGGVGLVVITTTFVSEPKNVLSEKAPSSAISICMDSR